MITHFFQNKFIALAVGLVLLLIVGTARADPPTRVARLGYTSGQVSLSPAGQADWVQATLNRPLTNGDHLWTDDNSRAELQIGGAAIRLGANTNLVVINLDDKIAQVELLQGSLKIRVHQIGRDQSFEVDTPNLSFSLQQAGDYRIDVDASGAATAVKVNLGQAVVDGDSRSYTVETGQAYRFYGTGLSDYDIVLTGSDDDLDRWSYERDLRTANSDSARYVSYEVVGYEDLDSYGSWRFDPSYGNVWRPNQIRSDWTPYRNGHWTWIDPWGWNWVDDAPWGYAVSHYGRWAHINGFWGWVPGPRHEQAVFAPALVVFVGGKNFQSSRSGNDGDRPIGWFPLAPREVYQPAYPVSRVYFDRVNRSNAVIASTTLINVYQTSVANTINTVTHAPKEIYVNQRVAGAVVAAPTRAFTRSQPVAKTELVVSKEFASPGDLTHVAAIAPTTQGIHGGEPEARVKPPSHERRIFARTASPANAPKERSPTEPKADAAKSFPNATDTARKPASQIPALNAEVESLKAAKVNWAREEAAKAEAAKAAVAKADAAKANQAKDNAVRADVLKAQNSRAAAAKADSEKGKTTRPETTKGEAPAKAPHARASEPGSKHKQAWTQEH